LKTLPFLAMPKPAMTPEDVEALNIALQEMHAAEVDVQKAFLAQRPWEERDQAIKPAKPAMLGSHWEPSSSRTGPYKKKVNGLRRIGDWGSWE
jgi:hypothetical protein